MKKQLLFAALAASLVVVPGCAEKQDAVSGITITPAIKTRVTELHFDMGDCIGLTVTKGGEDYVRNRPMTYDGSAFTGSGLLWYNDLNEKSTLTAYYPYSASGVPDEFFVAEDQTGGNASSDLLGAVKKDVTPVSSAVGMLFYHLMSQLTIVITNNSDAAVSEVVVSGFVPAASVDLTVPAATAKTGAATAEIKAREVTANASYRVILVPQQGALTVTVTTRDGKSRSKTLSSATLESGKKYDMAVLVTNVDIELTLSGDVSDWGDGGSLGEGGSSGGEDGGEGAAELEYGGEAYRTVTVGDRVWMAENLRYMPAGATVGSGVWYPGSDLSTVAEKGLLYNYATATGGVSARANAPLRGICPEGWHIPALAELEALVAAGPADGFFNCAGFWIMTGTIDKYGNADKGYLLSSEVTGERIDCLSYTTTSAPVTDQVSVAYGVSVRCVKD